MLYKPDWDMTKKRFEAFGKGLFDAYTKAPERVRRRGTPVKEYHGEEQIHARRI